MHKHGCVYNAIFYVKKKYVGKVLLKLKTCMQTRRENERDFVLMLENWIDRV